MDRVSERARRNAEAKMEACTFNNSQKRVAPLLLAGLTNKEIAEELGISREWVKQCVSGMFDLTGATNRVQLAAYLTGYIE